MQRQELLLGSVLLGFLFVCGRQIEVTQCRWVFFYICCGLFWERKRMDFTVAQSSGGIRLSVSKKIVQHAVSDFNLIVHFLGCRQQWIFTTYDFLSKGRHPLDLRVMAQVTQMVFMAKLLQVPYSTHQTQFIFFSLLTPFSTTAWHLALSICLFCVCFLHSVICVFIAESFWSVIHGV